MVPRAGEIDGANPEQLEQAAAPPADAAAKREFYDIPPQYIHNDFSKRGWGVWIARQVYNGFKTLFASVWFYFIPFSSLYLSFAIPYRYADGDKINSVID